MKHLVIFSTILIALFTQNIYAASKVKSADITFKDNTWYINNKKLDTSKKMTSKQLTSILGKAKFFGTNDRWMAWEHLGIYATFDNKRLSWLSIGMSETSLKNKFKKDFKKYNGSITIDGFEITDATTIKELKKNLKYPNRGSKDKLYLTMANTEIRFTEVKTVDYIFWQFLGE